MNGICLETCPHCGEFCKSEHKSKTVGRRAHYHDDTRNRDGTMRGCGHGWETDATRPIPETTRKETT